MSDVERPERYSVCPVDGAPLISTFVFNGFEWLCLECGRAYEWLRPHGVDATDDLHARYDALLAEWEKRAPHFLVGGSWRHGCERCDARGETHVKHASDAEREADRLAREWLKERTSRSAA